MNMTAVAVLDAAERKVAENGRKPLRKVKPTAPKAKTAVKANGKRTR